MSGMQAAPWALIVAALLAPSALHAQAQADSASTTAAPEAARPSSEVETGRVDFMARDTGEAGAAVDTTRIAKPGSEGEKRKHHRKESDSIKLRGDTVTTQSYIPY